MPRTPALKTLGFILAWVLGTVGSLSFLWEPGKTALDLDELYWLGSSYYGQLAFVRRDWSTPHWDLQPARENPPVAKYVLGLGLGLAGHPVTSIDPLSYFYAYWANKPGNWGSGPYIAKRAQTVAAATPGFHESFRESGRIPLTNGMIQAGRRTVLAYMVLASLLALGLGTLVAGRLAGLFASQLLLLHPVLVFVCNHAMADAVALMFSLAAALAGFLWFRRFLQEERPDWRTGLTLTLATGLLLALACGAKMNSLVLVGLMGLLVAASLTDSWRRDGRPDWRTGAWGLGILVFGLAVFAAINPTILRDPWNGLAATVLEHRSIEFTQAEFIGGHLTTLRAKLATVVELAFLGWVPFCATVTVAAWGAMRRGRDAGFRFLLGWWLVAFVCVTAWIPFSWGRYVMPLLPPTFLLLGYAVNMAIQSLRGPVRNS
ncbi:MAG: phospholipid carrier-dependent glycosyltransferase [Opitutae bacterium]|nr:phospholipid carrier-dependent glycosyltransferase [Opitutae bacterium]